MEGPIRPFFLQVSGVEHTNDQSKSWDKPMGVWLPPRRKNYYNKLNSTGWYVWDPGLVYNYSGMQSLLEPGLNRLRRLNPNEQQRFRPYRAATMFWDPYAHNYVHVPLDCTEEDVDGSESGFDWRRPGFSVCQAEGGHDIAVIGHSEEHQQLHLPGPGRWFEKLLPITLQPPEEPQSRQCKLAGDLDILIGLIAFSTTFEYAPQAIDCLFRPDLRTADFNPAWSNGLPADNRRRRKGLLIEIGYDYQRTNSDELREWERGLYGELFR
ncbi:hypothetical protein LTR84_011088 [Exophiala bonariae]|uniref:Uncharacterized protein n=1 Tax=Exophiala bonariae TaxID=1690606 RepID=A0AAV9NIP9_9EURO|nr:hypothetical protein LTR84_011088 [Exophiala bonariae]